MTGPQDAEAVRAGDRAHGLPWFDPAAWGDLMTWHDSLEPFDEGRPAVVSGDSPDWFATQVRGNSPEPPPDGFMLPPHFAEDFRKTVAELFGIPAEALAPRPVVPPTRRQRLKNRIGMWRNLAARRAYRTIAGYWPDDGEDD